MHLVALAAWLGVSASAGLFAAVVFPTMRELGPTLERFEAWSGSHADLAAGFVQARVFAAADTVSFASAVVALASMIGLLTVGRLTLRRWSSGIRLCGLGLALGLFSFWLMVLSPRMETARRAYLQAAEAGETAVAQREHAAFERDHPTASGVLKATVGTLAVTFFAAALSAARRSGPDAAATGAAPAGAAPTTLPEPELFRRPR